MINKLEITKFERIIYSLILLCLAIVTYMFYFFPDRLWEAVQEDAIIENITIILLLVCLAICIFKVKKNFYLKQNKGEITHLLLSFGLLFVIGEELSWGQRIFNITSGSFFIENNTQSETNIHNLQFGNVRINKLVFTQLFTVLLALYFLFTRLICRKIKFFDQIREYYCIPLPKLHHTIFFYFVFFTVYAFDYRRNNEVMEMFFPGIFMLILLFPYQPRQLK